MSVCVCVRVCILVLVIRHANSIFSALSSSTTPFYSLVKGKSPGKKFIRHTMCV